MKQQQVITFCLPMMPKGAVGGYKIIFELANQLANQRYKVVLLFDVTDLYKKYHFPKLLRLLIGKRKVKKGPVWYSLETNIEKKGVLGFNDYSVPKSSCVIATAVTTAGSVAKLKQQTKKGYYIQGLETWVWPMEKVAETYRLGMKNIVISNWLKKIVDKYADSESILIHNALDFSVFKLITPIKKRNPYTIAMLYHTNEGKGTKYGLQVIEKLKNRYKNLEVTLFGIPERPEKLPNWIKYIEKASEQQLCELYNHTAIYISPSINEGFGLTGAESMACGCALASFKHGGVLEYANNDNACLSEVKNVEEMYEGIIELIENQELRVKMAEKGYSDIKERTWSKTVQIFLNAFELNKK